MDKNEFIEIYNKLINRIADSQNVIKLVENYCIKKGKDPKESLIFAQQIVAKGLFNNFDKILDYFAEEFKITEIYNKDNKLIKVL